MHFLLVEDHPTMRLGVRHLVQDTLEQVGGTPVTALQSVMQGKRCLAPSVTDQLVDLIDTDESGRDAAHETLTPQEFRVMMMMIAAGRTPAEMAKIMHLSLSTIATYRTRVLQKNGSKNTVELTKYCVLHQLPGES